MAAVASRETEEDTMKALKAGIAVLVVTAVAITAGAAFGQGEPQWKTALDARSQALNEQHGLDAKRVPASTSPAWLRALIIRSEALNEKYGLGRQSRKPASAQAPAWLQALMVRSDALNRQYKLGAYAPGS